MSKPIKSIIHESEAWYAVHIYAEKIKAVYVNPKKFMCKIGKPKVGGNNVDVIHIWRK